MQGWAGRGDGERVFNGARVREDEKILGLGVVMGAESLQECAHCH